MQNQEPSLKYSKREIKYLKEPINQFSQIWQLSKKYAEVLKKQKEHHNENQHKMVIKYCEKIHDLKKIINEHRISKSEEVNKILDQLGILFEAFNDILHENKYKMQILDGRHWDEIQDGEAYIEGNFESNQVTVAVVADTIKPLIKYENNIIQSARVIVHVPIKKDISKKGEFNE
ncbi:MAG: hypothetical protein GF353_14025 [Candidatus Lokiarchaeota archaeon]|nr:hypothetical protein [Candidatus Lokiarchaeota archaeon]